MKKIELSDSELLLIRESLHFSKIKFVNGVIDPLLAKLNSVALEPADTVLRDLNSDPMPTPEPSKQIDSSPILDANDDLPAIADGEDDWDYAHTLLDPYDKDCNCGCNEVDGDSDTCPIHELNDIQNVCDCGCNDSPCNCIKTPSGEHHNYCSHRLKPLSMSNLGDLPPLDNIWDYQYKCNYTWTDKDGKTDADHDCDENLDIDGECLECKCDQCISTEPVDVALEPKQKALLEYVKSQTTRVTPEDVLNAAKEYSELVDPFSLGDKPLSRYFNHGPCDCEYHTTKSDDQLAFERELDNQEVEDHVERVMDTRPVTRKDLSDIYNSLARIIDHIEESTQRITKAIRLK